MAAEEFEDVPQTGFLDALRARHANSKQPESQAIVAVLSAIVDVINSQKLQPTPVSIFAAVVSSLSTGGPESDPQTTAALCSVLSVALERLPAAFLRSNFSSAASTVAAVIEQHLEDAAVLKPAVASLSYVLAAADPGDWPSAARPFALLLGFATNPRPKVRKRAHDGMVQVLAAWQHTAALQPASAAILQVCNRILPGPEAAARAASGSAKKSDAEALLHHTVNDALHLLSLLRLVLPLLTAPVVTSVCAQLLKLCHLHQRFLSRSATAALSAAMAAPDVKWRPRDLANALSAVLGQEGAWDRKDADMLLSVIRLLEDGFTRLHQLDANLAATRLAQGVAALASLLSAEQEGVRFAAAQALSSVLRTCLDAKVVSDAISRAALPGARPSAGQAVVAAVTGALAARYQDSWPHALAVATELLAVLGAAGAPLAAPLLARLDEIAGDAAAAEDEAGGEGGGCELAAARRGAEGALGAAVRSLGPEAVLDTLPLRLEEGINGSGEARTWLLPLVRQHTRGARLGYWGSKLLPMARVCGGLAAAAEKAGPNHQHQALQCRALELQLWGTLPSFCSWASDTATALPAHVSQLGAAFQNRQDLRPAICHALQTLCMQNRAALKAAGATELIGPGEPPGQRAQVEEADEDDGAAVVAEVDVPLAYTVDVATRNVDALRASAMSWLPVLCAAFVAAAPEARGPLGDAIAAYACICTPDVVAGFFRTAMQKLIKVVNDAASGEMPADGVREGGDTPAARRGTFLDLALCLAGGLADAGLATLFKTAALGLPDKDSGVQKKSHKVVAYLCESRPDFVRANLQGVMQALLGSTKGVSSAARRFRLRCLKAVILLLDSHPELDFELDAGGEAADATAMLSPEEKRQQLVASLVGEIVLACKEVNQKTRAAANDMLVDVAHAMHESAPPSLDPNAPGGLRTLFTMVLGGMVGESPHMVAASVMALARLLYEFGGALSASVPELMPAVLSLLWSRAREVVKAVLGFLKVVAMRLPAEALQPQLGPILEGVLLWAADSKNKFKLKVRLIVEKLARRCGFDEVEAAMPEGDTKLLTHIRKERARKAARKSGAAATEAGDFEAAAHDARSQRSAGGRTARRQAWAENDVFSDDSGDGGAPTVAASRRAAGAGRGAASVARSAKSAQRRGGARLPLAAGDEVADLLDAGTARQMMRSAAGQDRQAEMDDFARDMGGRMVIKDDEAQPDFVPTGKGARKRKGTLTAEDFSDDDGSDGGPTGGKAVRFARSTAGASVGGRSGRSSMGGKSAGGRSTASRASVAASKRGDQHSGSRFKAKKGGGDVKGGSKVEPYAYWPLDRKMLNRRPGKTASAKAGLMNVIGQKPSAVGGGRAPKRRRKGD